MFVKLNVIENDPPELVEKIINIDLIVSTKNIDKLPGTYLRFAGKPACEVKLLDGSEIEVIGKADTTFDRDIIFEGTEI